MPTQTIVLFGLILVIIVVRRVHAVIGGALAILLALVVGALGVWAFAQGMGVAFGPVPLSKPMFFGLIAGWLGIESLGLSAAIRRRRRAKELAAAEARGSAEAHPGVQSHDQ